jgi:succinyldiaminopimelate transaminase
VIPTAGAAPSASTARTLVSRLPAFPWDLLAPAKAAAVAHPDGIVDLSVGTPVDPVPQLVREALGAASNFPGYPLTAGTAQLREAAAGWLARQHGVTVDPDSVLPLVGTKEFIAGLPTLLGCSAGDTVCFPALAYPTYEIGARLAGAEPAATDHPDQLAASIQLTWLNSPSNPTGEVLAADRIAEIVAWSRRSGMVLASDECYIDLGFEATPVSVLHPDCSGRSHDGLLAVFSLSKRSNLAGYRAGFVAGDPDLISALRQVRKHAGLIVPGPVQAAMTAALADDEHAREQYDRYARRRATLRPALEQAGWTVSHSKAGLYLWATRDDYDCWGSVNALAKTGILVAPGEFYGAAGNRHVRVALTASDERIAAAARRLCE